MNRIPSKTNLRLGLLFAAASVFISSAQSLPPGATNADNGKTEGAALVREILSQRPEANVSLAGILTIRDATGKREEIPVRFETVVTATGWSSIYERAPGPAAANHMVPVKLVVGHEVSNSNRYELTGYAGGDPKKQWIKDRSEVIVKMPFAGDFGVADLGLEFFHWPEQRLIKKEMRRSRFCRVLESVNPQPMTNGYSRVVSWIDRETLGLVHAEAFDLNGRLLKEFDPKSFKKVNGQWELQEMEIRNVQAGSRSRIEFKTELP